MPFLRCIKTRHYHTNQTFSDTIKMDDQPKEPKHFLVYFIHHFLVTF